MKYVVLDEVKINFFWSEKEVSDFDYLWNEGRTLKELANYFKRKPEEVLLLALDRGMLEKIKPRSGGLIGEKMP